MPRMGGHGPRGGVPGEKAKDFRGTLKKLVKYMSAFKVHIIFVAVFAICGTVFNIVGPRILGKATTEIFNGLVSKVSGGSGMDFGKIGRILLMTLGLYLISALCSFIQGLIMTGVSQKTTYRLRKEISEKINRMPMNYFDTKPVGERHTAYYICHDHHRRADHDAFHQSSDDSGGDTDPAGLGASAVFCHETFTEIFPRTAGISGKCKRPGRRDLQRT